MVVSEREFAEQSDGLEEIEVFFNILIDINVCSTYTPASTDDYKSGLLANAFVFWVFYVAKECANDRKVLWTSFLGAEGQGRNGHFVDMGFGVGEGVVDEDSTSDERNAYHSRYCRVTSPAKN